MQAPQQFVSRLSVKTISYYIVGKDFVKESVRRINAAPRRLLQFVFQSLIINPYNKLPSYERSAYFENL